MADFKQTSPIVSGNVDWNAFYNSVLPGSAPVRLNANDSIVNRPAPIAPKPYTTDATNPLDISRLGLTRDPFAISGGGSAGAGVGYDKNNTSYWNRFFNGGAFFNGVQDALNGSGKGPTTRAVKTVPVLPPSPKSTNLGNIDGYTRAGGLLIHVVTAVKTVARAVAAAPIIAPIVAPVVAPAASFAPAVSAPTPVLLASGTVSTVGATGTAQGGAYTYAVQPDGSVLNVTTGRISAPAPAAAFAYSKGGDNGVPGNSGNWFYNVTHD